MRKEVSLCGLTAIGILATALLSAATAAAQNPAEHIGVIKDNLTLRPVAATGNFSVNGDGFSARDRAICVTLGNDVAHILLKNPFTQPPRGFDLNIGIAVGGDNIDESERPGCSLVAIAIGYHRDEQGRIVSDGEGPASHLRINQPSIILESFFLTGDANDDRDADDIALKSPQRFFTEPKPNGTLGNYPNYANWTLISRHDAPPLAVPATRTQYLQWQSAWLRRTIAVDEKERSKLQAFAAATKTPDQSGDIAKLIASLQSELKQVNASLAALSPAERSTPAWFIKNPNTQASMALQYVDAPANSNGARPLFVANPNYLDRTKDNHAQIILIDLTSIGNNQASAESNSPLKQLEQSWIPLLPNIEALASQ